MINSSTAAIDSNLVKLSQKYLNIVLEILKNIHLFNAKMPGIDILLDISNKALIEVLANPLNLLKCNLEYQLKVMQLMLSSSSQIEIVKQLHTHLFDYYESIINSSSLSQNDKQYLLFFVRQLLGAIAPDNFLLFNQRTLDSCLKSNFQSLLDGLDNFERDIKEAKGFFTIPNTNKFTFKIGQNIASTQGKVVYKNELIELICYKPKKQTFGVPLLIVPPCINKYYVLDLSKTNSFVKWLTDNNFQVFLISWANPKSEEQNFDYQDYIKKGIFAATDFISQNLGYKKINTLGYCIGGTMLASALACLNKKQEKLFHSATFLNTLLDFSNTGEISIFLRDEIIKQLNDIAKPNGYLDGIYFYSIFNMLKSKDLIWSAYINNYLEGFTPKAFDILYWNADYTNLPAKMLNFYLSNMCLKNLLIKPNALTILGKKIDLSKISLPSFFVAAKSDHIVPWEQSFKSMQTVSGKKTFCLTASGHVAGIINPPCNNKYAYWSGELKENANDWLDSASKSEGSWWGYYLGWLKKNSLQITDAINYKNLEEISPAPGTYVF